MQLKASSESILRIGMVEEPGTLNPVFRRSSAEGIINSLSVRSLAHYNSQSDLIPYLAKSNPRFVKNHLQFEIRENAKWSDGTPVTCLDFETGFLASKKFNPSKDPIVATDAFATRENANQQKCRIKFNRKKPIYTLYLSPPLPTHLERKIIDKSENEIEYLKNTLYSRNPTQKGLANGPYMLSKYKPGYYMEFNRNSHFYGPEAKFEKLQVRFFNDLQSMINAYRTKELDFLIAGLTASRVEELQKIIDQSNLSGKILSSTTTKLVHLEFNLENKSVSNALVRRALSILINPVELAALVGLDGELTGSLAHPTDPNFQTEFEKPTYKYNLKEALKLLKEAGFQKNAEGQMIGKDQKKLEINLIFNSENPDRERVAVYLENKWSAIGIAVHVKKYLKRVMLGEILKKGDFDVAVFGWTQPKLQINTSFFLSNQIPLESNQWLGYNFARWNNPIADKALSRAETEFETQKIKKHMALFQKEFRKDIPWLPLYFERRFIVAPKTLKNLEVFPDWESETYEIEKW